MSAMFKAGDRVRIITKYEDTEIGDEATVVSTPRNEFYDLHEIMYVKFDVPRNGRSGQRGIYSYRFELIDDASVSEEYEEWFK